MTENIRVWVGAVAGWSLCLSHERCSSSILFAVPGTLFPSPPPLQVLLLSVKAYNHSFSEGGKKEEGTTQPPQCGRLSLSHHIMATSALLILAALVGSCAQFTGKLRDICTLLLQSVTMCVQGDTVMWWDQNELVNEQLVCFRCGHVHTVCGHIVHEFLTTWMKAGLNSNYLLLLLCITKCEFLFFFYHTKKTSSLQVSVFFCAGDDIESKGKVC